MKETFCIEGDFVQHLGCDIAQIIHNLRLRKDTVTGENTTCSCLAQVVGTKRPE